MRRTIISLVAILALGSCTSEPVADPVPADSPQRVTAAAVKAVALETFEDCGNLQSYLKREAKALAEVAPWGLHGGHGDVAVFAGQEAQRSGAVASFGPTGSAADSASGPAFSGTNVQEEGVDEPDTVKTDGNTIFAAVGEHINSVAVGAGAPRLIDRYRTPQAYGAQLLLAGKRLLVLSEGGGAVIMGDAVRQGSPEGTSMPSPTWRGSAKIDILDVSDPSSMRLVKTVTLEGSVVSARLIDGVARIVLRTSGVGIELAHPEREGSAARRTAERKNRKALEGLKLKDWLPKIAVIEPGDAPDPAAASSVVPCDRVHRPQRFSGLEMVSVLSLDPANPRPGDAATVVGTGETVYASTSSMYVATNDWSHMRALAAGRPVADGISTTIHRFDISDPRKARYVSSGSVPGQILNQWSLSEHDRTLRVATTLQPWNTGASESHVTVLRERGKLLARIGRVTGLGKTERIYGVRFIGDLAYVVTFRQVDPLYVIDLSRPARPRVRGELKISGYSAYLHPVGDGKLLGIGAEATEEGMRTGAQATVFDVSDPDTPSAVDREFFRNGHTPLEHDHHAFLWWAPSRLALFPVAVWDGGSSGSAGAVALRIDEAGEIEVAGMLEHPVRAGSPQEGVPFVEISRAVVVGERVFTLSHAGLGAADLGTLASQGFIAWPQG